MDARYTQLGVTMRAEGLEPPRSFEHQDLNLDRLPVPARPHAPESSFRDRSITDVPWQAPLEESRSHPASQQGSVNSKEVWMTWEISAAASAAIGIA
jgi:hypothetical protein